jgi:hypothetical protein
VIELCHSPCKTILKWRHPIIPCSLHGAFGSKLRPKVLTPLIIGSNRSGTYVHSILWRNSGFISKRFHIPRRYFTLEVTGNRRDELDGKARSARSNHFHFLSLQLNRAGKIDYDVSEVIHNEMWRDAVITREDESNIRGGEWWLRKAFQKDVMDKMWENLVN